MPDLDTVRAWQDRVMVDADGGKIGNIESIYVDDQTGEPEWALVHTGLFGTKSTFVPLAQATPAGDQIQVPYQKQLVKDAPGIDPDQHLSESEEQQLWRHYGLEYGTTSGYEDRDGDGVYDEVQDTAVGRDTSGPTTDDAMTRSEEELQVGTETRERGRARLRKYVTTETQQVTVPVQREEVRVEREPITDANLDAATSGPAISEEEHEVTLREEEVVVDKRAVPKERVRLDKDTVTDERQVAEEVRKEQIEVDGDQSTYRDDRV
ncbi:MAG TPA: YsnF/AvaK domain-containing protein [Propionibacteriaceae bacterium]|nr:YsnF/AvaK domain-containing protein [Propionibacteriaceae bacterium]